MQSKIDEDSRDIADDIDDLEKVKDSGLYVAEDADLEAATLFVDLRDEELDIYASKDNEEGYLEDYDLPASVKKLKKLIRAQGSASLQEFQS